MDIQAATAEFLHFIVEVRRLADATVLAYRSDLRRFQEFVEDRGPALQVSTIDAALIESFMASCSRLSARSVSRRLSALSSFLTFLRRRGHIAQNPVDEVARPRQPKTEPKWVTDADLRALLDVTDGATERAILLVLACAGLRRSEVIGLDVDDVELDSGHLRVRQGKGQTDRTIPTTDELRDALAEHMRHRGNGDSQALFTSSRGTRLSNTCLQRMWQRWLCRAGLERRGYRLHSLRHSAASRWIRAGMNVRDIQTMLGHRDISTTGAYLHSSPEHLRQEMAEKVPRIGQETTEVPAGTPGIPEDVAEGLAVLGKLAKVAGLAQLLEREAAQGE